MWQSSSRESRCTASHKPLRRCKSLPHCDRSQLDAPSNTHAQMGCPTKIDAFLSTGAGSGGVLAYQTMILSTNQQIHKRSVTNRQLHQLLQLPSSSVTIRARVGWVVRRGGASIRGNSREPPPNVFGKSHSLVALALAPLAHITLLRRLPFSLSFLSSLSAPLRSSAAMKPRPHACHHDLVVARSCITILLVFLLFLLAIVAPPVDAACVPLPSSLPSQCHLYV